MGRVVRHDRGQLSKPVKTPQGLRVEGYAGRAGVYRYDDGNGGSRLELRPRDEVFHADALAGFEAAPITNGHPGELIANDPLLRAKHGKGVVLSARRDGDKVAITGTITDPTTIAEIESGKRELSPGYTVELDETPGIDPEFGRYDAIQRSIRIDHQALVTKARGGSEMAIRMDGARHIHVDEGRCAYADEKGEGGVEHCDGYYMADDYDADDDDDDKRSDAELTAAARANLGGKKFAVPGKRKLPIHDAPHIRAAMSRFGQTEGLSSDEKSSAAHRIVSAAKKAGINAEGFAEKHGVRSDKMDEKKPDPTVEQLRLRCDELDAKNAELVAQLAAAKAKLADLDAVDTKLRAANERADEASGKLATYEATLEKRIRTAAELRTKAVILLGPQARVDGISDDDVCRAVLRALTPNEQYDAKTPEWRRVRVDELVKGRDQVAHEREQIARAVRGDAEKPVETKPKHTDLYLAGPPETRRLKSKER